MIEQIPVAVLCGGPGTRLRALVPDRPKSLAMIGAKPFLGWQLDFLWNQGFRRFHFLTGHGAHLVEEFAALWGAGRAGSFGFHREETRLGTGGALSRFFASSDCESALVVNADTFFDFPAGAFVARAMEQVSAGGKVVLSLARAEGARFSRVDFRQGQVHGIIAPEDGQATVGWVEAGYSLIHREALEGYPGSQCVLSEDVYPALAREGKVSAISFPGEFLDIGTVDDFLRAEMFVRSHGKNWSPDA